jgi:predicted transposase YbfD/YdcC
MAGLISILREVHDPRDMNARHDLASILFLALAATLCGAKSCVQMAEFADGNVDELSAMVPLPHGAPSHDTFSRVFRLLDPAELARAFAAFMAALREELGLGPARGVVAVDAKSLRRGYEKGRAHMPPLMVSVWDTQTRLSIAQGRAPGNGEVKATLALLKGLVLKGCTVTADALHGHAEMARTVRARKAHYCLGLKGNRGPLHGAVEAAFAKAGEKAGEDAPFHETTESRHGRQERRRASVLPATALEATHAFPGLVAVGRIEASRTRDGATTQATRYLLLSRRLSPRKLLDTVRAHWSIENHLHWTLDVVFDEDDARSRKNYAPENLAVIRRLALNILNAHPDKRSTASKMRQAKWKQTYFLSLFAHLQ